MSLLRLVLMMPSAVHRQQICEDLKRIIKEEVDIQSCSSERLAYSKIQQIMPHGVIISDQANLSGEPEFHKWVHQHNKKVILLKSHAGSGIRLKESACELIIPSKDNADEWGLFVELLADAINTLYTSEKKHSVRLKSTKHNTSKIVFIGASTGGGAAIQDLLRSIPSNTCPIIVAQHLPAFANDHFRQQIGRFCPVPTDVLRDQQIIDSGHVWLIPGGHQAEIYEKKGQLYIHVFEDKQGYRYHPCIDHLFYSATGLSNKMLAILLTGMGSDGAHGLRELKDQGVETWVQDEGSMIPSMPQAALQLGAVKQKLSIQSMQHRLPSWIK